MSSGNSNNDIAVIGAGIVGLATALTLQQDGHRVTLIDQRDPGMGTSFGNAGAIVTGAVAPVASPGLWRKLPKMLTNPDSYLSVRWSYLPRLMPWLWQFFRAGTPENVERIARELAPLVFPAYEAHQALMRRHGIEGIVRQVGWLKIYDQAGFDATSDDRALLRRHGVRFDELDADELRQLEPGLNRRYTHAIFQPGSAFASTPLKLSQAYAEAIRRGGGSFKKQTVQGIEIGADGRPVVVTEAGRAACDRVVVAAGAWSKNLAAMLGARVPLDTERGYHLYLERKSGPGVGRPTLVGDHGFVLAPMADGVRLTFGVELAGVDAPPDFRRIRRMVPRAQDVLPGLSGEPQREWLGYRPSLPDSKPVIGPSPRSERVTFAFGHGHLGLTLSAVTGRCVADLVAKRKPAIPLEPFAATRF
ncbi:MAG: FAD-binding oxidoreductase [Alphaproteobacteria bacterium]|nr:FAD-binding oxidoreductase [Alphaproteobacteria bacterium]